jgi:hypothetical protein
LKVSQIQKLYGSDIAYGKIGREKRMGAMAKTPKTKVPTSRHLQARKFWLVALAAVVVVGAATWVWAARQGGHVAQLGYPKASPSASPSASSSPATDESGKPATSEQTPPPKPAGTPTPGPGTGAGKRTLSPTPTLTGVDVTASTVNATTLISDAAVTSGVCTATYTGPGRVTATGTVAKKEGGTSCVVSTPRSQFAKGNWSVTVVVETPDAVGTSNAFGFEVQ